MSWDNARKRTNNITVNRSAFNWMVGISYAEYNKKQRLKRFLIKVKRKLKNKCDIIKVEQQKIREEYQEVNDAQYKMFEDIL